MNIMHFLLVKKSEYGVVTLHYNNTKLRKLFDTFLPP